MKSGPHSLSVLSYVLIKTMNGKLDVGDPRVWWADALDQLAARPLPLRPEHAAGLYELPPIHKHPFDRMLIAQAIAEDLELVTTDRDIPMYAVIS
jgi:PIN domain nuclease of toxin-antitoxin system